MPADTYRKVTVTYDNGTLKCEPPWLHLYWKDGPTDIRWVFEGAPKEAVGAVVEYLPEVPVKLPVPPGTPGVFHPRGVHRGFGHHGVSAASHLQDIVTSSNTQEDGYFCYDLKLLDVNGDVIARTDPGGDNQPTPPASHQTASRR